MGSKVPPFIVGAVQTLAARNLPCKWLRDIIQDLVVYVRTHNQGHAQVRAGWPMAFGRPMNRGDNRGYEDQFLRHLRGGDVATDC